MDNPTCPVSLRDRIVANLICGQSGLNAWIFLKARQLRIYCSSQRKCMWRTLPACIALFLAAGSIKVSRAQVSVPPQQVLNSYCVTCHNQKLRTAGLSLETAGIDHPADN